MDQAIQPAADLTRVPFHWYQDASILEREQRAVFEGPVWNYLCIESDIPNVGDWRTTFVGRMPVVVVRTESGAIAAFENRCLHRGALICFDNAGNSKDFTCVYHAWRYDLTGNLKSVAFGKGVNGKGGMPAGFRVEDHAARKLRVTSLSGIVFGTFSDETPTIEDYVGPDVLFALRRNASRKLQVIGRFTEVLPNNWKMYAENVRDTYHASLLHVFFATFKINRLSQGGGVDCQRQRRLPRFHDAGADSGGGRFLSGTCARWMTNCGCPIRPCWMRWMSTAIGSGSRSSACFPALRCSGPTTCWRSGISCRRGSIAPICNGSISGMRMIRRTCGGGG